MKLYGKVKPVPNNSNTAPTKYANIFVGAKVWRHHCGFIWQTPVIACETYDWNGKSEKNIGYRVDGYAVPKIQLPGDSVPRMLVGDGAMWFKEEELFTDKGAAMEAAYTYINFLEKCLKGA